MNTENTRENGTAQGPANDGSMRLLETGREAFPEIIRQICSARQEILLHMFIWREDRIGTEIAAALLEAADRGVSIVIEKDRYGLLLEYAEESQRSFCHIPDMWERLQIEALCLACNRELFGKRLQVKRSELYRKLEEHPNVVIKDKRKTTDHSKYYIFDRQIMILGGINIEDKEIFSDSRGRVYFDYMVRICDPEIVSEFLAKRESPRKKSALFRANMKEPVRCFELKESFLELIDEAQRELTIIMAYFAPDKEVLSAVCRALDRGVSVRILIPGSANFMQASNMRSISRLLTHKPGGRLSIFQTDYMVHAKLLMNEKHILTGSCNITQKSLNKLGELCICADNDDAPFACEVRASVEALFQNHAHAIRRDEICINPFMAAAEAIFMR